MYLSKQLLTFIIHQIFLSNWSKCITWLNMHQIKLGNIRVFQTIYEGQSRQYPPFWHWGFCPWTLCVNLKVHSFLPAALSENLSLFKTDNVRRKISVHIFAPNRGYCLYITASYTGKRTNKLWQNKVSSSPFTSKMSVSTNQLH